MTAGDQPGHGPLPDVVVDHGDRLEVRPAKPLERVVQSAVGAVLLVAGIGVAVLAPGALADEPLLRAALSAALVVGGLLTLARPNRRLEVGTWGVTQRGIVRSRTIAPPQVEEIVLDEHREDTGPAGRRIGGVRVSMGGNRRRIGLLDGIRRHRWMVSLRVRSRGGQRPITIGLRGTDLDEARTLVEEMRSRAALPDDLPVTVHSDR